MYPKDTLDSLERDLYYRAIAAEMAAQPDFSERMLAVMENLRDELVHRAEEVRSSRIMLARVGSPEDLLSSGWSLCECSGNGCPRCDGLGVVQTKTTE